MLRWYPDDIWRYVLACQWQRISQEEAFPGRCAESGDELGSTLITARLVRDSIRLIMLMRRCYPPYGKIRRLPSPGAVDQFIDSTDAAGDATLRRAAVRALITR